VSETNEDGQKPRWWPEGVTYDQSVADDADSEELEAAAELLDRSSRG
jgi:hypothetical protein